MGNGGLPRVFGAVESGGSNFVCLIAEDPDTVHARSSVPAGEPGATLDRVADFFAGHARGGTPVSALGVAAFGPVELRSAHPRHGELRATPKAGWEGAEIAGRLGAALGVPVGFDTDVNGAALGEGEWGAARGIDSYVYLNVGSGIGGGAVHRGALVGGLVHPEMGHMSVPRLPGDDYPGRCPFHGDCLEGLASGPALTERFEGPVEHLPDEVRRQAVETAAHYLASGLRDIVYVLAPQRIVIGGGTSTLPGLLPAVRRRLADRLGGYPGLPEHAAADFVSAAALGPMAGPAGALILAERAWESDRLR